MAKGNAFLGCVVFKERAQLGFDFVFLSSRPTKVTSQKSPQEKKENSNRIISWERLCSLLSHL